MLLLRIRNVKKSYGNIDVLKDINLDIKEQGRTGLVGYNGSGKTTLAKIIANLEPYDSGFIDTFNKDLKICYLKQVTEIDDNTFHEFLKTDEVVISDVLESSSKLGLKNLKAWSVQKLDNLSGGEVTKLSLTQVFNESCDLLILDEPTNHLDYVGIEWLIKEIKEYKKSIIIISHDRYFLDQVVEEIAEIEDGKISLYNGNYSSYRKIKEEKYLNEVHQYLDQKKKERHIEEEINRVKKWSHLAHRDSTKQEGFKEYYRVSAKKKDRQIKSKLKSLEKMRTEGVNKPKGDSSLLFEFVSEEKIGLTLVNANNLSMQYDDKVLFKDTRFYIKRGEKIGLIGINGSGKTTLIKMLIGDINDYSGELYLSPSAKIAYLSQDVLDLDENISVCDMLSSYDKDFQTKAKTYFVSNGITTRMIAEPIRHLSLGERTRVKLIFLILQENNVLILDEPTNHLDLHSIEQLEYTLDNYTGTIIIASHDRYLLSKITDKLLVFENEKITRIETGYKEYTIMKETKKTKDDREYQLMIIQNKITYVLSELNKYKPTDVAYLKLDQEFKELINKKNQLSKT